MHGEVITGMNEMSSNSALQLRRQLTPLCLLWHAQGEFKCQWGQGEGIQLVIWTCDFHMTIRCNVFIVTNCGLTQVLQIPSSVLLWTRVHPWRWWKEHGTGPAQTTPGMGNQTWGNSVMLQLLHSYWNTTILCTCICPNGSSKQHPNGSPRSPPN